jgi:hypothetical protein
MAQSDDELQTFARFLEAARLPVRLDSITSRRPPEPDIACELLDGSEVRFELVEIVDETFARRVSDQIHIQHELGLAAEARGLSSGTMCDALVFVVYRDSATSRQRLLGASSLTDWLGTLPDSAIGRIQPLDDALRRTIQFVSISRGRFTGPVFQVDASSFISNPLIGRVSAKFAKKYVADNAAIELLAHYDLQPAGPPEVWTEELRQFVPDRLSSSQFRRVWVFDSNVGRVVFRSDT